MADEITTKKVENLSENTEPADTDVYLFGASGTNVIKKIKWSNILTKLRNLLFANNCTTTQAGYGLDARQGKALQDQVNELNTKKVSKDDIIIQTKSENASASSGAGTATINVAVSGYKAIGIVGFSIASTYYAPSAIDFNANNQTVTAKIRHVSDNAASGSVTVYVMVLYMKA